MGSRAAANERRGVRDGRGGCAEKGSGGHGSQGRGERSTKNPAQRRERRGIQAGRGSRRPSAQCRLASPPLYRVRTRTPRRMRASVARGSDGRGGEPGPAAAKQRVVGSGYRRRSRAGPGPALPVQPVAGALGIHRSSISVCQPADRRLAMLPALSYLGRAPAACRLTRPFPSGMCATPAAICTRPCRVGTGRTDGSAATPAGACISARRLPRRASAAVCCTMHISHRSCDIAAGEISGYCPSLPPRRQAVDPVRHGRVTPAESHAMDRGGPCAADLTSASRASTLPGATVCPWRLNLCPRQLPTPSLERIPYHRHSPTDLLQD